MKVSNFEARNSFPVLWTSQHPLHKPKQNIMRNVLNIEWRRGREEHRQAFPPTPHTASPTEGSSVIIGEKGQGGQSWSRVLITNYFRGTNNDIVQHTELNELGHSRQTWFIQASAFWFFSVFQQRGLSNCMQKNHSVHESCRTDKHEKCSPPPPLPFLSIDYREKEGKRSHNGNSWINIRMNHLWPLPKPLTFRTVSVLSSRTTIPYSCSYLNIQRECLE